MKAFDFLNVALRDYKVGAITKSSRYTVRAVLKSIRPGYTSVVEYGAGDGTITKELLTRLPAAARVVAVELNKNFLPRLHEIKDARLSIKNEDVVRLSDDFAAAGLTSVDAVISGIPFTFFSASVRDQVVRNTHRQLQEGGVFVVYQYSLLMLPVLKKYFRRVTVHFVLLNIPPYFVMVAEK